jgi:hypothetical protein
MWNKKNKCEDNLKFWIERKDWKEKSNSQKKFSIIEKLSSYNPKRNKNQKNEDYIGKK